MSFKPFALRGVVVHGHGRGGTKLGFPTANVQLTDHVTEELKRYTNLVVYGWGCVMESGEESENSGTSKGPYPIAMSIGFNPHFHDKALTAEVHFLHEFGQD
ncbi:riboflavin kinase, partial [Trypanosoma grayi]|uniref:riboflavin kinase n=1 Tax=Trypanosoma grayi TaxID=71804 RepID=UPI0004F471EE